MNTNKLIKNLSVTKHFLKRYNERFLKRDVDWSKRNFNNHFIKKLKQSEKILWSKYSEVDDYTLLPFNHSMICVVYNHKLITVYKNEDKFYG